MGGYGSTRWAGYVRKTRVEESLPLTADSFRAYEPETVLALSWNGDNRVQAIRRTQGLTLLYTVVRTNERIQEDITLKQPTHRRWYFHCPDCDRLAGKLYKPYNRIFFRCRLCYDLSYRSVQERRKYQSLARSMAKYSAMSADQWERFFISDWAKS